jgi:uncharacterized coiled-coil protein SlyX
MDAPLCQGCRERDVRIAELEGLIARLQAECAALKTQLAALQDRVDDRSKRQTPRAAAPDLPKPPDKKPTGRKPGGQPDIRLI